jgi:Rrf2 family protein
MLVSQKTRYALRAVLELAKRRTAGHTRIADLARAQMIPPRFLEVILTQLKRGGFVESRRGSDGGYLLARSPSGLTVGEVVRFLQGPFEPVEPTAARANMPESETYAFGPIWDRLRGSVAEILEGTTFSELVENEARRGRGLALDYAI